MANLQNAGTPPGSTYYASFPKKRAHSIAPRAVPAVIEGATEQISPKYRGLTEAYYKAVAAAGSRER